MVTPWRRFRNIDALPWSACVVGNPSTSSIGVQIHPRGGTVQVRLSVTSGPDTPSRRSVCRHALCDRNETVYSPRALAARISSRSDGRFRPHAGIGLTRPGTSFSRRSSHCRRWRMRVLFGASPLFAVRNVIRHHTWRWRH
jgi:hypothetical protein